ncbi:Mos1 transposase HTH domain-containing protein [Caenorhabditis elegans]|uniref:Mos1 transposase HTH domain-containing protein n=1 Tax=Caenorhabditis elegans TaxID=6239 RepID=C8TDI7_CAEEL|nr:Mos1 transposase HTH domain-containing protein [Caenorhabditis elegans]CBG22752.1 Mos1 transposase HTH domain-containing protein [Caenorhabditis elegans]|eukprot:NP_001256656.1 Uncharacterized protein CELE_Y75B12B.1 [Caenorhabditis elegans]
MASSLRTDPAFLRTCVLYEVFKLNTFSQGFANFCSTFGNDIMHNREFEFWHRRFYDGNHDLGLEISSQNAIDHELERAKNGQILRSDPSRSEKKAKHLEFITSPLCKDPEFVRSCVLYEVFSLKDSTQGYKDFCDALGNESMGVREFDFWWNRFYNGDHDLCLDMTAAVTLGSSGQDDGFTNDGEAEETSQLQRVSGDSVEW